MGSMATGWLAMGERQTFKDFDTWPKQVYAMAPENYRYFKPEPGTPRSWYRVFKMGGIE